MCQIFFLSILLLTFFRLLAERNSFADSQSEKTGSEGGYSGKKRESVRYNCQAAEGVNFVTLNLFRPDAHNSA